MQFMENFCYERKTLFSFAKHHETGEPLPEDLYQKLCAARTFRAGSMMMRQVAATPPCMHVHPAVGCMQGWWHLTRCSTKCTRGGSHQTC